MGLVSQIVSTSFPGSNETLLLNGIPASEIAEIYGTPLFVYRSETLEYKWNRLRGALPAEFQIAYSVKANPTRAILEFFLDKKALLEIASGGEFYQALTAGCPADRIIFAGPGKTPDELEYVLSKGIGEIHAESLTEIERISSISRRIQVPARVAIRINPSGEAEGGAMRMGGRPAPFGIDEEQLDEALDGLFACTHLHFKGIQLFAGTQILDSDVLIAQYAKGCELARRVARRLGRPIQTVDLGGGLGIPYFSHERELDIAGLQVALAKLFKEVRHDPLLQGTRFLVEPGRYLVAEAGVYITRVVDIKVSRGKRYLITDGGMHHHLAASGNLGQTIKRNYPVALLNRLQAPAPDVVDIVGPLCTPLDVLARGVSLPHAEIGDLVGVFQSGAYARAASPLNFLSHPTPPEVWVKGNKHSLIRRRGEYDDYLRDLCVPAPLRANG
jgi:diaminopimelate decarboxylase